MVHTIREHGGWGGVVGVGVGAAHYMSHNVRILTFRHVCPAKIQISLRINAV